MRRRFGKIISDIASKDRSVRLIVGDIGYGIFDEFRKKNPNQFINMGICEQSIMGISAGMALEGLKPWVYTITPFLIERPFEQVKLDIDQQNVNVKLIGFADYPTLGPTHSEIDAKKLMSQFKNINSFYPEDSQSTEDTIIKCYKHNGPCFVSLKTDKTMNKNW